MRLALAALLLVGCATQEAVWVKPGSTEQAFNMDRGQCLAQAQSATAGNPMSAAPIGTHAHTQMAIQQAQIFQSCMYGKGWTQARR
jgi:uncharacterized protein YcfL